MKIRLTRKWKIVLLGVILAVSLTAASVLFMEKISEPEEKVTVYEFKKDIEANSELLLDQLNSKKIPISQMKDNYVTDLSQIEDSVLAEAVRKNEYLVVEMLSRRGENVVTQDLSGYWEVSVDVTKQQNFIGHQLIRGEKYQLFYREIKDFDGVREKGWISEVIVLDLIDEIGNKVFKVKDESIHSVVLAVQDLEALKVIVDKKLDAEFELVKAPAEFKYKIEFEEKEINYIENDQDNQ